MIRLIQAMLCAALLTTGAAAQTVIPTGTSTETEAATPDPATPEAVREMVSRMSDGEVRALLLDRLDAVAKASETAEGQEKSKLVDFTQRASVGVFESVADAASRVPRIWTEQTRSLGIFYERLTSKGILFMAILMSLAIAAGLIAEFAFRRFIRNWQESAATGGNASLRDTVVFLFKRLCADILAVVIFWRVAEYVGPQIGFTLAPSLLGNPMIFVAVGAYISGIWWWLIILPRFGAAVGRFFLAPHRAEFRLVYADDATARYIWRHTVGFMLLLGFTIWVLRFNEFNGVPMGEARLGFWLNVALHGYFALIAWKARYGLSAMLLGPDPDVSPTERKVARAYPYFIIGVAAVMWWITQVLASYEMWDLLAGQPQIFTMILLTFAPAMDTLVRGLVRHLAPQMKGEGELAGRAHIATKRSYIRAGRVIVFVLVMAAIGKIWGIDFTNLAEAGVGAQFAGRFIEIIVIIAFGYLVWELVSLWINRKLADEMTAARIDPNDEEPGGGEGGGAGGSRLSTVLPLLLGVMKAGIAVIFGLIALGNVGIDITPLLAGAGIFGLAIGFGAQKLVADVVSGIFFLVDDAFRSGEYVEVSGTVGTVEKISIRSMQLRHHKGPVHTIPYGEVPQITNYSRDWVIMKLKFTVPFDTDPNKVKKMFKTIGKEMMEVPEFAADLLQPFKSQGVFDFDDVGMIIRGKFMAKPGKQFTLRKEIYNRVKKAFEENGIDFARREVRVAIPTLDQTGALSEDDKAAIATAAGDVAREAVEGQSGGEKK